MKKKFLLILAMAVMLVCVLAVSVSAAEFDKTEKVSVKLSDGTTQQCALYDENGNALVWYTLDEGATLISVKASELVYSSQTQLANISLADGTELQKLAETSVNKIVVGNFRELTFTEVPQSGYKTTFMKSMLVQYLYMPSTLTTIRCNAVQECKNLVVFDIPSDASITTLEANTFNTCSSLKEINLGNSLTGISSAAFYGCSSLETVYIDPNSPLANIDGSAFDQCASLTQFGLEPTVCKVPDTVKTMGNNVFKKAQFTILYLPASLTSLGYNVADGNKNLTDVYMPNVLTSWGVASFYGCSNLERVHGLAELFTGGYLTAIPDSTFYGCSSLEYLFENNVFPTGIATIGSNAFRDCTSLKTPTFPNTLKVTGSYAFYNCDSFGPVIVFPNSLETFGQTSLGNCGVIETVYMGAKVKAFGGYDAFNTMASLTTIYMPSGITSVPINTFHNSGKLSTVYFTGTEAQLAALYESATKTGGNTNFTRLTPISYTAYMDLDDKSGMYAIYDYNACDAFYNGIHVEKLNEGEIDTNPCVITLCAQCKGTNLDSSSESTHSLNTVIAYANGFNLNGTRTTTCQHAGCAYNSSESAKPEAIGAIFTGFGISTRIEDDSDLRGIAFTMLIDRELLAAYEENTGTALSYGVLTTFAQVIGTNNPLDNTGTPTLEKGIVATDVSHAEVYAVDLVLKGTKALWEEEAYELDLYMLGYTVENGNVTYMGTVNSVATASANVSDLKTTTYKEQIGE